MILSHLRFRKPRLAVMVFALFASVFAVILWAQDTPIVVSDGSLSIRSTVQWTNWADSGGVKTHPNGGKAVPSVEITMPGHNQTISFSNQHCTVTVTYASDNIVFATVGSGRGLQVRANFSRLRRGADDSELVHTVTNSKISRVVVTQNGQTVFDNGPSGTGKTSVTIHYQ